MADHDTLCGWGNQAKVAYFLANADVIVPRRAEQLKLIVELMPYSHDASISVLDLGAGFGAVTEQIIERYSRATVNCIDGSEAMVVHATKRLRNYQDRVTIMQADLAERSWLGVLERSAGTEVSRAQGVNFDAVVSALAIHHLSHERKRELYREIFRMLKPGGMFLNNDVVATPPALKVPFEALHLAAIQEQERSLRGITRPLDQIAAEMHEQLRLAGGQHHSHIAPLSDQLAWLVEAGFKSVDCYWRYLDLTIFGGIKEPAG